MTRLGTAIPAIRSALLSFYDSAARDLPWRRVRDPYAIWISEVMAQQTRVETVIPYYERWLRRFPDVDALAAAPTATVLKLWEGLGYYSRARNLHAAARLVRERHAGALPGTYDELRALPGIGEYTAGAVASIAFNERAPAVDGNVRRVLARLLDEPEPSAKRLRAVATALVPADRPGDFNQAMMELGATICTPRTPRCTRCPISSWCAARAAGTQHERPAARPRRIIPVIDLTTLVVRRRDGRLLVIRRPERGLLGGMYAFPSIEAVGDTAVQRLMARYAQQSATAMPLCVIEHTFSHRLERYTCWLTDAEPRGRLANAKWIGGDRSDVALPKAQQRIHAAALASG